MRPAMFALLATFALVGCVAPQSSSSKPSAVRPPETAVDSTIADHDQSEPDVVEEAATAVDTTDAAAGSVREHIEKYRPIGK